MARHRHIVAWLEEVADDLRSLRQDIHAHPELGYTEERRTAALVAECLRGRAEVHEGIGRTGVIGVLRQGDGTRRLGLLGGHGCAADRQATGLGWQLPRRAHARLRPRRTPRCCSARRYLAATTAFRQHSGTDLPARRGRPGRAPRRCSPTNSRPLSLRCAVRHAQHAGTGRRAPGLPRGTDDGFPGPAERHPGGRRWPRFVPHLSVDPLLAASSAVMALQSVVARNVDPQKAAVVTVGALQAGEAANVIPQRAVLRLSLRALDGQASRCCSWVRQIIELQAASYGARPASSTTRPIGAVNSVEPSSPARSGPSWPARSRSTAPRRS